MDQSVKQVLSGDAEAINSYIKSYTPKLKALIQSMVGEDAAKDILQDSWIAVFTHLHAFKHQSSFTTWVYSIVLNKTKSHLRSAWETKFYELPVAGVDDKFKSSGIWRSFPKYWDFATPEALLEQEQLASEIPKMIGNLPDQQRIVFMLHDVEQINFYEICNILELKASNVRVTLHRARRALYAGIDNFLHKE